MQLIRGLDRWPSRSHHNACVATIGNFDGIHRGHQAIFEQLKRTAACLSLPSLVISFNPLPHEFFAGDKAPARLQSDRDRIQGIAAEGIDRLLLLPFNDTQAKQSANDFVESVLAEKLSVKHLLIGDDFRFGFQRQGDFNLLKREGARLGFKVEQTDTVVDNGERISSTRIREHLVANELAEAHTLLGRPYSISGRVIHGEKVGRQLGFPTANVALKGHKPPLRGVFAVVATDLDTGKQLAAVANLGERPTVGGRKLLLEVHFLNTQIDCYGHYLRVDFLHHVRSEKKFDSLDELKAAIADDASTAGRLLFGNSAHTSLDNSLH